MNNEEIVRIFKDGMLLDTYHEGFGNFNKFGYKNYERPFVAQFCRVVVEDVAEYTDKTR